MFYKINGSPGLFKKYTKLYKKPPPHDSWGNFLIFPRTCNTFVGIIIWWKLIKITWKYIKGAYTTDKHNLIFGIPLLQECEDDIVIHTLIISA